MRAPTAMVRVFVMFENVFLVKFFFVDRHLTLPW